MARHASDGCMKYSRLGMIFKVGDFHRFTDTFNSK